MYQELADPYSGQEFRGHPSWKHKSNVGHMQVVHFFREQCERRLGISLEVAFLEESEKSSREKI